MKRLVSWLLTIGCGFFSLGNLRSQEIEEADLVLEQQIGKYISSGFEEREHLSPDQRARLIDYCKRRIAATKGQSKPRGRLMELVFLGDEETIRSVVKSEGDIRSWARDLIESGSPVAIEVLIPFLFKEEPLENRFVSDVEIVSISHHIADALIPEVILRSQEFDPKVTEWANLLRNSFKPGDRNGQLGWTREVMRQWWRENEQYFRARNYKAVRPGLRPPWAVAVPVPPSQPEQPAIPAPAPPASEIHTAEVQSQPVAVPTPAVEKPPLPRCPRLQTSDGIMRSRAWPYWPQSPSFGAFCGGSNSS